MGSSNWGPFAARRSDTWPTPWALAADFYVATTGDDTTGTGAANKPWRTPEKARAYIRANGINTSLNRDVVVGYMPGTWWGADAVLANTNADAGSNGFRVRHVALAGPGSVRWCGGVLLSGWELVSGSIYKAAVSGTPWTLYENGVRAQLARTPAFVADATFPLARPPYKFSEDSGAPSHTVLQYVAGDITPAGWDLTTAGLVVDSGGNFRWFRDRLPITGINAGTRQITVSEDSRYVLFQNATGSRYFVEGVPSLLTGPGQFYVSGGFVYYWPRATPSTIAAQEIVAPTMGRVVTFIGADAGNRASYIGLDGITVQYSDFTDFYRHASVNDNDRGGGAYDRQNTLEACRQGLAYFENTDHLEIKNCAFKNAGFSGMFLNGYNQDNLFENWLAEKCGHSGVYADGPYPGAGDVLKNNVWRSFRARDVGELVINGSGIVLVNASGNLVTNGEVLRSTRWAVAVVAYTGYAAANVYAKNNRIQYVAARACGQDSGDMAAFYSFGTASQANTWRQLVARGVRAHPSMLNTAVMAGAYSDNEGGGQTWEDVQVSDTQGIQYFTAGADTLTNTSFLANGQPNGSFDATRMQTAAIGPCADFPWP
jgi:hypothetical protein